MKFDWHSQIINKKFRKDIMKILYVFKVRLNGLALVSDTEASAGCALARLVSRG
jgi:hypothetical protein